MPFKSKMKQDERLEFDMTPMIDCCFQLIIFFMLTLRFSYQEGNFNIRMPVATTAPKTADVSLPTIQVKLSADPAGNLAGIMMNQNKLGSLNDLHAQIRKMVKPSTTPGAAADQEVELECDYKLKYAYVMSAISAVSGYLGDDKKVVRLIDKVKFAPLKQQGAK